MKGRKYPISVSQDLVYGLCAIFRKKSILAWAGVGTGTEPGSKSVFDPEIFRSAGIPELGQKINLKINADPWAWAPVFENWAYDIV